MTQWTMPAESAPHVATWMAYGARRSIWGRALQQQVQRNLRTIAVVIAEHAKEEEKVCLLVRANEMAAVQKEFLQHLKEMNLSDDPLKQKKYS